MQVEAQYFEITSVGHVLFGVVDGIVSYLMVIQVFLPKYEITSGLPKVPNSSCYQRGRMLGVSMVIVVQPHSIGNVIR